MKALAACCFAVLLSGCAAETSDPGADDGAESEIVADPRAALRTASFSISKGGIQPTGARFVAHPDFLAANVPLGPVSALRTALESKLAGALKNRGEAHVTTITPPEMGVLKRKLSMSEVQTIAAGIQSAALTPRCVGMGESGRDRTFYLVVESSDLLAVRRAVAARYVEKGGARGDFDAEDFLPHVTLGFTKRDLFEQDGVVKSVASCPNPTGLAVQP
jgi:2'-5' RNA ligase